MGENLDYMITKPGAWRLDLFETDSVFHTKRYLFKVNLTPAGQVCDAIQHIFPSQSMPICTS